MPAAGTRNAGRLTARRGREHTVRTLRGGETMKAIVRLLLGGACLSIVPAAPAADHAYVVSYIEAMPSAKDQAADMFKRLALLSRKEPGAVRFEVLHRI